MPLLEQGTFQVILGIGPPISSVKMAYADADEVHKELDDYKHKGDRISSSMMDIVRYYEEVAIHAESVISVSEQLMLTNMSFCIGKASHSDGYFVWNETALAEEPQKFVEVSVAGDYYWSANLSDTTIEYQGAIYDLGCSSNKTCSAVIDTGTSLLTAPTDIVGKIQGVVDKWAELGGSCDDLTGLPDLEFKLNGIKLSLPPQAYVGEVKRNDGDMPSAIHAFMPHISDRKRLQRSSLPNCELLVMSADADSQFGPVWILGMPFFRKYFTHFHFDQKPGARPEAATMAFSLADEQCRPGAEPPQDVDSPAGRSLILGSSSSGTHRSADLEVDADKILVPSLAHHAKKKDRGLFATRYVLRI
jgi:hypothetical protein